MLEIFFGVYFALLTLISAVLLIAYRVARRNHSFIPLDLEMRRRTLLKIDTQHKEKSPRSGLRWAILDSNQ